MHQRLLSKVLDEEERGKQEWGSADRTPTLLLNAALEELGEVAHAINHSEGKQAIQQEIAEVIGVMSRLFDMVDAEEQPRRAGGKRKGGKVEENYGQYRSEAQVSWEQEQEYLNSASAMGMADAEAKEREERRRMPTIDEAIRNLNSLYECLKADTDPSFLASIKLGIEALRAVNRIGKRLDDLICSANENGEVGVVTWLCAVRTDLTLALKGETEG